jgi:hypothetical protein
MFCPPNGGQEAGSGGCAESAGWGAGGERGGREKSTGSILGGGCILFLEVEWPRVDDADSYASSDTLPQSALGCEAQILQVVRGTSETALLVLTLLHFAGNPPATGIRFRVSGSSSLSACPPDLTVIFCFAGLLGPGILCIRG